MKNVPAKNEVDVLKRGWITVRVNP